MSIINRDIDHLSIAAKEQSPEAYVAAVKLDCQRKVTSEKINLVRTIATIVGIAILSYLGITTDVLTALINRF